MDHAMRSFPTAKAIANHLRSWVAEGNALFHANFGLTARERDGALLVIALFILGLAVQWLRWLLG